MATSTEAFYGCLCLEVADTRTVPPLNDRITRNIPLPEIHFNIWEEGGGNTEPFLDIGIMLATNDPAERIEIFLPWELKDAHIEDLSSRILGPGGVSAIFNEAWTSSTGSGCPGGFVTRGNGGGVFTIVPYDPPQIKKRQFQNEDFHSIVLDVGQLTAISNAAAVNAPTPPEQMYVRIRVKGVPQSFYRVGIDQGDALGGGALYRTEIIDFRLNVRRGVPTGIESSLRGRFLDFSKVQLFLMKSRDHDIAFEDKLFKACRSLEDEKFWAGYILARRHTPEELAASVRHVQGSLGYQWKKTPEGSQAGVKEFGTLARFKSFRVHRKTASLFLALALVVGAAGNGVYDGVSWIAEQVCTAVKKVYTSTTTPNPDKEAKP
jgi:hypothetical protein